MATLEIELGFIGGLLPLAAAAHAEVRAPWLCP